MYDYRNALVILSTVLFLMIFFSTYMRKYEAWRATVTPLASIIGSGFLVSAPLLILTTGKWAYIAISSIVIVAYLLGFSIRYNILNLEPLIESDQQKDVSVRIEKLSKPFLGLAYIISVTFYLKLLSAFFFRGFNMHDIFLEECLTTCILVFIGGFGWYRGLSRLERLEEYSVNIKLSIIFSLILGSIVFNIHLWMNGQWVITTVSNFSEIESLRKILGILIIIQGFETSRYLGEVYSKKMRIRTMKYAQIISGVIYVSFISLSMVMFNHVDSVSEVVVIELCKLIAPVLPFLLIIAAIMSQFSAAVADALGSAGLISEATKQFISMKNGMLLIAAFAVVLTWLTSIYDIVSIASRAFALYYALQCMISLILVYKASYKSTLLKVAQFLLFFTLFILMVSVLLFGIPAE